MMEQALLATTTLVEFLETLHDGLPHQTVADKLKPHGGPRTAAAIHQYQAGARNISSRVQLAYCRAFGLSDSVRVHFQTLAGEAAGCPQQKAA